MLLRQVSFANIALKQTIESLVAQIDSLEASVLNPKGVHTIEVTPHGMTPGLPEAIESSETVTKCTN